MVELLFGPAWFNGTDILIDLLSLIVLFLIGFFSLRFYRINPTKKTYKQLGISFFIISLAFAFKILTNFTIYYNVLETHRFGLIALTYQVVRSSDILYEIGTLLYRILTLIGLYFLYSVYDPHSKTTTWLAVFLLTIAMYFSEDSYYVFHITTLILLILITARYFRNYGENKNPSARLLAASFGIITLSQLVFCFIRLNPLLYVTAELIQLIGYTMLLITFIKVLNDGKEKKQTRHHR